MRNYSAVMFRLLTFSVTMATNALKVYPMARANVIFEGSSASIFVTLFLNALRLHASMMKSRSKGCMAHTMDVCIDTGTKTTYYIREEQTKSSSLNLKN